MATPSLHDARLGRISSDAFVFLAESGLLENPGQYELCDGHLIEKPTQGFRHQFACEALEEVLLQGMPVPLKGRANPSVRISNKAVLDPDFAILSRSTAELGRMPTAGDVVVVFEVGDSTIGYDREDKRLAYASSGIPIYWLLDMTQSRLIVHSEPKDGDYGLVTTYGPEEEVELPILGKRLKVGTFFPPS
ncbi:Uma2 family endonuclease [bacterium]|nr:MAG: Uma2 family endonuclease [bacterium]